MTGVESRTPRDSDFALAGVSANSMSTRGWKWDVDIYDRPGWHSYTYTYPHWGGITRRDDGEIVVRFESADESAINDDFYIEHYRTVFLSSRDGGLTWREVEPQWTYNIPLTLSDGTWSRSSRTGGCEPAKSKGGGSKTWA